MAFENTIDKYGDEATMDMIIERTIDEYCDDTVTKIGESAFSDCISLTKVDCPNVTSIDKNAFARCTHLTTVNLPELSTFPGNQAFFKCSLNEIVLPKATVIGTNTFDTCSSLITVDLFVATQLIGRTFNNCYRLTALIIRTPSVCQMADANCFYAAGSWGTGFYVYVPRSLVDSYKAATNWSTHADKIRALEDYTVDGTTTGELDETKI